MNHGLGFVFPGQGSQSVGMLSELGSQFPVIRETFGQASEVLSYDLWELVQTDSHDELSSTSVTQPAILASSVAIWRLWLEQGGVAPALMAGHSLGEYSALVCSGVIAFDEAVRLVRKRGEYMQSAVPKGEGGMAAIVGLDDETVTAACAQAAQGQVVAAVNFNSPGQVVIAGHEGALQRAMEICRDAGARRALVLPVSAPFHSELMKPAAEKFAEELASVTFRKPQIPVIQNFGLEHESDPEAIKGNLIKQIYSPVPWVQTIALFAGSGVGMIFELGPGKVLCGLIKRIEPDIQTQVINEPGGLGQALETVRKP